MSEETPQNEPENEPVRTPDEPAAAPETGPATPRELADHHVGALREWLESPLEYPRTTDPWAERADDFMSRNFNEDEASPLDFPRQEPASPDEGSGDAESVSAEPVLLRYDGETGEPLFDEPEAHAEPDHPKRRAEDFEDWSTEAGPPIREAEPTQEWRREDSRPWRDVEAEPGPRFVEEPSEASDLPVYPHDDAFPDDAVYEQESSEPLSGSTPPPGPETWSPALEEVAEPREDTPFGFVNDAPFEPPFVPVAYVPETTDETVRRSGLAWSSGIAFFGSVAFMLFLGWLVDLLLGSSPWGVVGGIILGSVIGFMQFFRISSRIFKNGEPVKEYRPILSDEDRE